MLLISFHEVSGYWNKWVKRDPRGSIFIYKQHHIFYQKVSNIVQETAAISVTVFFLLQPLFNYASITMINQLPPIIYSTLPLTAALLGIFILTELNVFKKFYITYKTGLHKIRLQSIKKRLRVDRELKALPELCIKVGFGGHTLNYIKKPFVAKYFSQVQDKTVLMVVSFPNN